LENDLRGSGPPTHLHAARVTLSPFALSLDAEAAPPRNPHLLSLFFFPSPRQRNREGKEPHHDAHPRRLVPCFGSPLIARPWSTRTLPAMAATSQVHLRHCFVQLAPRPCLDVIRTSGTVVSSLIRNHEIMCSNPVSG
jgi:hypothetical protein